MPYLIDLCAFTDIHYCDEKAIPVGVAFKTEDYFYPMVTGKDIGCGVTCLQIEKKNWLKSFDKNIHYNALNRAHKDMTDDGLGGGNHFLSIEEDDNWIYIMCHTGSRNRGIALYQTNYGLVQEYKKISGQDVEYIPLDQSIFLPTNYWEDYNNVLNHAVLRRKNFVLKTLTWLQVANYVKSNKLEIPHDYMKMNYNFNDEIGKIYGTNYILTDSIHNHHIIDNNQVIHRKGSTELKRNIPVVIPLSMSRGCLIVKSNDDEKLNNALYSCSHGAGRKLSRFDAMKYWRTVLKEKERRKYKEQFVELLDKSGDFPSGYIQEFDYAYKDSSEILIKQPYLKKITQTTPIITIKYTEI